MPRLEVTVVMHVDHSDGVGARTVMDAIQSELPGMTIFKGLRNSAVIDEVVELSAKYVSA